jgi:hypothetical protein
VRKSWAVWTAGVALLALAWGVTKVTPGPELTEASFIVDARIGEEARGAELILTVDDVMLADRVEDSRGWGADGVWVVADMQMSARTTEEITLLGTAHLIVDGRTYRASERPASLLGETLGAGIVTKGSVAFELPSGVDEGPAVLRFAPKADDLRLDSVIELAVELSDLDRESTRELRPTEGGGL